MYQKYLILFTFILLLSTAVSSKDKPYRTESKVSSLLVGEWESVNYVFNPQKAFTGSKEEKEQEQKYIDLLHSMLPRFIFKYKKNGKYNEMAYSRQNPDARPKENKGKWRLEDGGDVLVVKFKDGRVETQKILLIDHQEMEVLYEEEGFIVLLQMKKK